jgi:hypothetical protein
LQEAVDGRRRTLGGEHPDTHVAAINLGRILINLGDLAFARRLLQEVYEQRARTLGPEHAETVDALAALAPTLPKFAPGMVVLPAPGVPQPRLIPERDDNPSEHKDRWWRRRR